MPRIITVSRRRCAWLAAFVALFITGSVSAFAQQREFKDIRGNVIKAEIIAVKEGQVTIKREDGREFTFAITMLSEADQAYIKEWVAEAAKPKDGKATTASRILVEINPNKGSGRDAEGDYDDRMLTLQPILKFNNKDFKTNYKGLKGTIMTFGASASGTGYYKVLTREEFTFDIPGNGAYTFSGQLYQQSFDTNLYAKFGYAYRGYIFVLRNAEGEVIQFKSTSGWVKTAEEALRLRANGVYDGKLQSIPSAY